MHYLISKISTLRKGKVKKLIDTRMSSLSRNFFSEDRIFSELCFCLLTANERAAKAIEIQERVGDGFLTFSTKRLALFLKKSGYRFYNTRARYIVEARQHYGKLKNTLSQLEPKDAREWLVENIQGLGYKESSHLLRNLGFFDVAILDRHILRIMYEHGMLSHLPKKLDKKNYLEIESKLEQLCKKLNMKQGELDFYLWYIETGNVLK